MTTPRSDSDKSDKVKKRVRWLLQNNFTFIEKKTMNGKDYLYARKRGVYRSAGPYSIAEPYLRSLLSNKEPEPVASRGADEMAAAARREFDQLEADAIADPSRLKDYIRELVPRKNPDFWRRFCLLAGSDGLSVLDAESVDSSYRENLRTAVANGSPTPIYHAHVVEVMNEWIQGAIQRKRGSLAPRGIAPLSCNICNNKMEAYPNPSTEYETCRVWCNSCKRYKAWSCGICDETLISVRDDKQSLYLRCPKCGYGYDFAEPIKLTSPRTYGGWELLDRIRTFPPGSLIVTPTRFSKW